MQYHESPGEELSDDVEDADAAPALQGAAVSDNINDGRRDIESRREEHGVMNPLGAMDN